MMAEEADIWMCEDLVEWFGSLVSCEGTGKGPIQLHAMGLPLKISLH